MAVIVLSLEKTVFTKKYFMREKSIWIYTEV